MRARDRARAVFDPVQSREEVDVLPYREVAVHRLVLGRVPQPPAVDSADFERVGPVDPHPASRRRQQPQQPQQRPHERRLPGAVRPGNAGDLGAINLEVDTVERGHRSEFASEAVDVEVHAVGKQGVDIADTPADVLSDRQREAVLAALELGYHDQPRGATHEDVAATLDAAPSTASEHLRKAEAKLVRGAMR